MSLIYLLLGSNQGDRLHYLSQALLLIENNIGIIEKKSSVYESQAWGYESQNKYVNQVVLTKTNLSPEEILNQIHFIENTLGRIRNTNQYTDRTLDIDILLIDNLIIETPILTVPHPLFHKRKFALIPLTEINTTIEHPVLKKSVQILFNECNDSTFIDKL